MDPAPERSRKTTWKEFLRRHKKLIASAAWGLWMAKLPTAEFLQLLASVGVKSVNCHHRSPNLNASLARSPPPTQLADAVRWDRRFRRRFRLSRSGFPISSKWNNKICASPIVLKPTKLVKPTARAKGER